MNIRLVLSSPATGGSRRGGHRTRVFTDAVLSTIPLWIEDGMTPREIARGLGVTLGSLRVTCSQHGISLRPAPGGYARSLSQFFERRLGATRWEVIRREAQRRDLSPPLFIMKVLATAADGKLFDAILDDAEDLS